MEIITKNKKEERLCLNTNDFRTICDFIDNSRYSKLHVQAIVEVNARQFEITLIDYADHYSDDIALYINFYENSVCRIDIETRDRWDREALKSYKPGDSISYEKMFEMFANGELPELDVWHPGCEN